MDGSAEPSILAVDDEEFNVVLIRRCLRKVARVIIATDGAQAIEILKGKEPICALFCDLKMPGIGGLDVLRAARQVRPDVVRVIVSAYADVDTAERAVREIGLFRITTKPFSRLDIIRVAEESIGAFRVSVDASPPKPDLDPELRAALPPSGRT